MFLEADALCETGREKPVRKRRSLYDLVADVSATITHRLSRKTPLQQVVNRASTHTNRLVEQARPGLVAWAERRESDVVRRSVSEARTRERRRS